MRGSARRIRDTKSGLFGCMLQENDRNNAISICVEGGDGGNQRHRAYLLDGIEFPALPRILSKTAAVSRAEAGDRYRNDLLLCRRTDGGRDQRAVDRARRRRIRAETRRPASFLLPRPRARR